MIESDLLKIIKSKTQIIDVRAPCEYEEGHLPFSINLPLLTDEERAQVGTAYKKQGRQAAIDLGHSLVAAELRQSRIEGWVKAAQAESSVVMCFRGGLRSQIAQQWINDQGLEIQRVDGGYKHFRQFLNQRANVELGKKRKLYLVGGPTGAGKSRLLNEFLDYPGALDLERMAHHRGSAFGAMGFAQPSQSTFENSLFWSLCKVGECSLLLEDESRMIGKRVLPENLFAQMRGSALIYVDESVDQRVQHIFEDYVLKSPLSSGKENDQKKQFDYYISALAIISKKLGGLRAQRISNELTDAFQRQQKGEGMELHKNWIRSLIVDYYDPLYQKSLERRSVKIWIKGSYAEILSFLKAETKSG